MAHGPGGNRSGVGVRDEATDQTPARELPRTTGVRVLIVEDNPDAADSLEALLDFLGHRVRIAGDGPRALALARTEPPDVMLIDIGLPGMDGYEVARHVRQDARLTGVLLVALTGYGRAEDRAEALAAGFDRHLVKPVDAGTLQELVAARTRDAAGA